MQVDSLFSMVSSLIEKVSIRFGFKPESSIFVTGTVPAMFVQVMSYAADAMFPSLPVAWQIYRTALYSVSGHL